MAPPQQYRSEEQESAGEERLASAISHMPPSSIGNEPHAAEVLNHTEEMPPIPLGAEAEVDSTSRPLSQVDRQLHVFRDTVQKFRRGTPLATAIGIAGACCGIAMSLVIARDPLSHSTLPETLLIPQFAAIAYCSARVTRLKRVLSALAARDDLRITGPLLESTTADDVATRQMAMQMLSRLLRRFQASDAKHLTESQYILLLRTLTRSEGNTDYFVAALQALEQIGDLRALPIVEGLAKGRRMTMDPKRVQAAARACLPYLQVRCDNQRASQTLLRASASSATPSADLLRPARDTSATESDHLLRPQNTPLDRP